MQSPERGAKLTVMGLVRALAFDENRARKGDLAQGRLRLNPSHNSACSAFTRDALTASWPVGRGFDSRQFRHKPCQAVVTATSGGVV